MNTMDQNTTPSSEEKNTSPVEQVTSTSTENGQKNSSSKKMKRIIGIIIALIIILPIFAFLIGVYTLNWKGDVVDSVMRVVPLPAASVNGAWVSYAEWREGVATVNHFYAQKEELGLGASIPDLTQEEIESNELDRLIERHLLEELAAQFEVTVSNEEIEAEYTNSILPQATDEAEVIKTVDTLYGWSLDEFKQEIVREVVLRAKLQEAMNQDETLNASAKQTIDEAKSELDGGGAFADVASKYSEDSSAQNGGDLDWIKKGETVPEFENVAFATAVGAVSAVFTSPYGYHILTVLEAEEDRVHVAHVLTKFVTIDEEIVSRKDAANIRRFVAPEVVTQNAE